MGGVVRRFLPALIALAWLALSAVGGPFFGQLSDVQSQSQADFLPENAESTQVRNLQQQAGNDDDGPPAIIVATADGGVTPEMLVDFEALLEEVAGVDGVDGVSPPIPAEASGDDDADAGGQDADAGGQDADAGGPDAADANEEVAGADGQTVAGVQAFASITGDPGDVVGEIRDIFADAVGTISIQVTGPAGFSADLVAAFAGIDSVLLVVAVVAVFLILLAVYRSPILPLLVLVSAMGALAASVVFVYLMADAGWIDLNGQAQGILFILVIGAATDYALLLIARYRDALRQQPDHRKALRSALRGVIEPILASAGTVIAGLLCLLLSDLTSNQALGPVASVGVVCAVLAATTLLPALLALTGRAAFYPFVPKPGAPDAAASGADVSATAASATEPAVPAASATGVSGSAASAAGTSASAGDQARVATTSVSAPSVGNSEGRLARARRRIEPSDTPALWRRLAEVTARFPLRIWVSTSIILVIAAGFAATFDASGVPESDVLLGEPESVAGQEVSAELFGAGLGSPAVVVGEVENADALLELLEADEGVATVDVDADAATYNLDGREVTEIEATLTDSVDSDDAVATIERLREAFRQIDDGVLVGGDSAAALDSRQTAADDLVTIIPLVLLVITAILMLLLRSVVAPLLLITATVVSYLSALGISALVFNHLLGFPGADPEVPLFAFVFLVALGIDYSIFLTTRSREESIRQGTRPGVLEALRATGGVITSAGVVLAATFAALAVIPLLFMVQLAFIVALGVLIDTLIVRSLVIPGLFYDVGPKVWWPSKLARSSRSEAKHG